MKVTESQTVYVELEDGDTGFDLYDAVGEINSEWKVSWVPMGHNRPVLAFSKPTA